MAQKITTPKISIMLAAHREGLLAHKTLKSLAKALEHLDKNKVSYEVLVNVDNGDKSTIDYFEHQSVIIATLYKNSFKDLGASRNFLVDQAKGEFLATLDADDLISRNWLIDAYQFLKDREESVVAHSEMSVNFGTANILWHKTDSFDIDKERLINVGANRWDSAIMAHRSIYKKFRFLGNTEGYGAEDWHFNCETIAAGIAHKVVPQTVLFVRRKEASEMTRQAMNFNTVRYTDLLEIGAVKAIDNSLISNVISPKAMERSSSPLKTANKRARQKVEKLIRFGRRYRLTRLAIAKLKAAKDKARGTALVAKSGSNPNVPNWLFDEWKFQHQYDRLIFPSTGVLDSLKIYRANEIKPKDAMFKAFTDQMSANHFDHILFVPWLDRGGADLVSIRYANELSRAYPDKKIAVIATRDPERSVWAHKLDDEVDFIDFSEITSDLPVPEKMRLLARIIVQSKVKSFQIINSSFAYDFAELHMQLMQSLGVKIYPSAFCPDISDEGRVMGHIHNYLPKVYEITAKIFTDNKNTVDDLVAEYGYDPERFKVHYQPVDSVDIVWQQPAQTNKLLWASRVAHQKRPDLLVEIARKLQSTNPELIIEAYGDVSPAYGNRIENAELSNLVYKGSFDGFYSLDHSNYAGLVYTSDYDGMPNVVLEASNIGMPMVASNIGGIDEIITDKENGFLVNNSVDDFVEAISKLVNLKPKTATKCSQLSRLKVREQHDIVKYPNTLKHDIKL